MMLCERFILPRQLGIITPSVSPIINRDRNKLASKVVKSKEQNPIEKSAKED